jgi:hypothetical protein
VGVLLSTITPEDWFWYVFGTTFGIVAGVGIAVIVVLFVCAMLGIDIEWPSKK